MEIPRICLADREAPQQELAWVVRKRRPVVITGLVDRQTLPALDRWTPGYFSLFAKPKCDGARCYRMTLALNEQRVFTHFGDGMGWEDSLWQFKGRQAAFGVVPTHRTNVRFDSSLFAGRVSRPGPPYHYFSKPLKRYGNSDFPQLVSDAEPTFSLFELPNSTGHNRNVWFAQQGSVVQTHYDIEENFLMQVYGSKVVRLLSPDQVHSMHPYPAIHPGYKQSQVDASRGDDERTAFPHFRNVSWVQAVLSPGDVLYLPAFWSHHIEAPDASISLNTWFDGRDEPLRVAIVEEVLRVTMEASTSSDDPVCFMFHYIGAVASGLWEPGARAAAILRLLFSSRYEPLFPDFVSTSFDAARECRERRAVRAEAGRALALLESAEDDLLVVFFHDAVEYIAWGLQKEELVDAVEFVYHLKTWGQAGGHSTTSEAGT